jgi:hypothetical protein
MKSWTSCGPRSHSGSGGIEKGRVLVQQRDERGDVVPLERVDVARQQLALLASGTL